LRSRTYSESPLKIIIHEDWNTEVDSYDADIALLLLEDELTFTKFIKPICLWENFDLPFADEGIIAGWGKHLIEGDDNEKVPRQLKVPIVGQEDCIIGNIGLTTLASKRTFCGGSRGSAGPCNGKFSFYLIIAIVADVKIVRRLWLWNVHRVRQRFLLERNCVIFALRWQQEL
jgi:hypothetical protein